VELTFMYGDASLPTGDGPRVIAHIVNDQGRWGAGFTRSLTRNWPEAEFDYRLWHTGRDRDYRFMIGDVRYVCVQKGTDMFYSKENIWVAHMLAQVGLRSGNNPRPLRYDALGACLLELSRFAELAKASVHMPKIGAGLSGGNWDIIQELIQDALPRNGVETVIYKTPPKVPTWKREEQ
jgi:O-acetyl-ADP-ribose deacetylase (regulator of RNase III)